MSGWGVEIFADDEPLGECNRCRRQTWDPAELGLEDRMTQPDGNPCGGRLVGRTRE